CRFCLFSDTNFYNPSLFYKSQDDLIVNKENFCRQIQQINDKNVLVEIIKVLQLGKELKNIIILEGYDDLEEKLNFADYNRLLILAKSQLEKLNLIDNIDNKEESNHLLDLALEDIYFEFVKIGENELKLADELKNQLQRTREALVNNFDHQDPQFILLKEELERIFKKKNLNEVNQRDMTEHIHLLDIIYKEVQELNRKNNLLKNKYQEDEKYVRIHKRLLEDKVMNAKEIQLYEALLKVKDLTDSQLEKNKDRINQEDYFEAGIRKAIAKEFVVNQQINLDASARMKITNLIATEYFNQYQGRRF
ncbi:type I restriction endonuclease subunit R, partial [Myroides marinus]|nr:type I restriction endonuclease subunit R [Myroides marinus]